MREIPRKSDLIKKIQNLISGHESRKTVSEWAFDIYNDDSLRISDPMISNYLEMLGAVDLPSSDRNYLYTEEDFREWISELHRS
ncbi:hypothetical protein [Xylocopilactobacillus apis]|uniref:DNA-binding protein n=1 Tax=Xylocopilactobacillus apis TaxID=2932183 RepID=A0AAU9DG79_9LACO|nr:hypothetical protein [Xylocopilactobacillus apis]BDR55722.1 hypothetical protein KIMC2_02840 [Xylocopilactobacillus apis]